MSERSNYIVARASGPDALDRLERLVEQSMEEGFRPQGGVSVWMETDTAKKVQTFHAAQALIRSEMLRR